MEKKTGHIVEAHPREGEWESPHHGDNYIRDIGGKEKKERRVQWRGF